MNIKSLLLLTVFMMGAVSSHAMLQPEEDAPPSAAAAATSLRPGAQAIKDLTPDNPAIRDNKLYFEEWLVTLSNEALHALQGLPASGRYSCQEDINLLGSQLYSKANRFGVKEIVFDGLPFELYWGGRIKYSAKILKIRNINGAGYEIERVKGFLQDIQSSNANITFERMQVSCVTLPGGEEGQALILDIFDAVKSRPIDLSFKDVIPQIAPFTRYELAKRIKAGVALRKFGIRNIDLAPLPSEGRRKLMDYYTRWREQKPYAPDVMATLAQRGSMRGY